MNKNILIFIIIFISFLKVEAQDYPLKVAVLGNSLVNHEPKASIGWTNNWGMAASAKEKDFVHLLEKELKATSSKIELISGNIGEFERRYWDYDLNNTLLNGVRDFSPDIIVFRIGENIDDKQLNVDDFHKYLQAMVKYIANGKSVKVLLTNCFWTNYYKDSALLLFAQKNNYGFVDLTGLFDDKTNTAQGLFSDVGVAAHPSDKGMQAIKDRIWKGLSLQVDELFCNYYKKCNYCQEGNYIGSLDVATCDTIKGWTFDSNDLQKLVEVEVWVDDKPYINLLANLERPDLQRVYGEKGLKHGFKYAIPSGVAWRDGKQHKISVKPCWKDAKFLLNSGAIIQCTKPDNTKDVIPDYVSGWVNTECDEIIGWVYDKNNLSKTIKVDFILNDKIINTYDANVNKPNLLPILSNTPDAIKHLFIATVPNLPKGSFSAQIKLNENSKTIGNNAVFQCPKIVLGTSNDEDDKILIYPNPNQGEFNIVLSQSLKSAEIQLFDSYGRECYFAQSVSRAKVQGLIPGVYFLRVQIGEKNLSTKVIVE
jgi:Secretion system C-terminal sorting domain